MMRTTLKQSDTSQEEKQDSPENKDLPPKGQDDDLLNLQLKLFLSKLEKSFIIRKLDRSY
jgi:hypothetical protein